MKNNTKLQILILLALSSSPIIGEPNPQQKFEKINATQFRLDWTGEAGWTYFIQTSIDLKSWSYVPELTWGTTHEPFIFTPTSGSGELIPTFFTRLAMRNISVASLEEAKNADFDSDGIPNIFELETLATDPLDSNSAGGDSDSDGLNDGWERYYFGNLTTANPTTIQSGDGLTNKEKSDLGLNPNKNYTAPATMEKSAYTYDLAGRLTQVSNTLSAATYTLDEEGNVKSAQ